MPRTSRFRAQSRVNPALVLIALVGILSMPVDYRAGAAISHPHATLQLLLELTSGSLDHHANPVADRGHDHGTRHHRHFTPAARPAPAPPVPVRDQGEPWNLSRTPSLVAAMTHLMAGTPDHAVTSDEPTLSPRTGGGPRVAYTVLLPISMTMLVRWLVHRLVWAAESTWSGVTDPPELPPPRRA